MNYYNLTDELSRQAQIRSDAIAIDMPNASVTFYQLEQLVWRTATFLYNNRVRSGNVAAHFFKNEFTLIVVMLATARIGATVFSISRGTPFLLFSQMMAESRASVILTDLSDERDLGLVQLFISMNELLADESPIDHDVRDKNPQAPWQLIIGSGSTGKSKLIPVSHLQAIARTDLSKYWLPITSADRISSLSYLDFASPKHRFLEALAAGATFVLFDGREKDAVAFCKTFNISVLHATVFHIGCLLDSLSPDKPNAILGFLKILSMGSSSVHDDLRTKIRECITSNLYVRYATNEGGPLAVVSPFHVFGTSGSVGEPLPGVSIEVVDSDGNILPVEKVGLIRAKGQGVIDQYYDDAQATENAFRDGWFYPGDLGKMTKDGQLIHFGRADHMMIMNGINIYPVEIEQVITTHLYVADAAVMPVKSPIHQDIPVCAVVLNTDTDVTEKELLDFTYQRLGSRGPKRVIVLDKIPRTEQGKLIRAQLAHEIAHKLGLKIQNER